MMNMNTMLRASVTAEVADNQIGDPVRILVDGADTPITANGLPGYLATPGDRLLVQQVGTQVEVVQFLSRGSIPYLGADAMDDLAAEVDAHDQALIDQSTYVATLTDQVNEYQTNVDSALSTLQGSYDVLHALGATGVEEDYFWVGDDPALSTVKPVQISVYVQNGLSAGDSSSFGDYFGVWTKAQIGDITFPSTVHPPMTTFYDFFTAAGLSAMPWYA